MRTAIQGAVLALLILCSRASHSERLTLSTEIGGATASGSLFPRETAVSSAFCLGYESRSWAAELSLGTLMWMHPEPRAENLVRSARVLHYWELHRGRNAGGSWFIDAGGGMGALTLRQGQIEGRGILLASALRITLLADTIPRLLARLDLRGDVADIQASLPGKQRSGRAASIRGAFVAGLRF